MSKSNLSKDGMKSSLTGAAFINPNHRKKETVRPRRKSNWRYESSCTVIRTFLSLVPLSGKRTHNGNFDDRNVFVHPLLFDKFLN